MTDAPQIDRAALTDAIAAARKGVASGFSSAPGHVSVNIEAVCYCASCAALDRFASLCRLDGAWEALETKPGLQQDRALKTIMREAADAIAEVQ